MRILFVTPYVPSRIRVRALNLIKSLTAIVDCISWLLQQQMDSTRNLLKKAFVWSELQMMRYYERYALADFDRQIITTTTDRDKMSQLARQAQVIEVGSNGVDTDYYTPLNGPRAADSLVFCAKLDYFQIRRRFYIFVEIFCPFFGSGVRKCA